MTTVSQLSASDALVNQENTSKNYAGLTYLALRNDSGSHFRVAMYFNRPFPIGATIISATLRLHQTAAATGGSRTLTVRRLAASYKESTVSWANIPAVTGATATSSAQGDGGAVGREWAIDVTALMQEVSDGAPWYGFRIESNNSTRMNVFSREATSFQPTLDVTFGEDPDVPTVLAPSNGRAVSIARPTLRFDFTDLAGDTSMASYQVQMNLGADDPVSPDYDSGVVAANIPEHLVTFDVDPAEVWHWRVQVEDGAGLWSGWSEWVTFTRTAKPTVTITNPAASPNDFVTESTPPFSWTATGQVAYQLFITDPDDVTEVLWTSGKVTSTDNTVTLPDLATPILSPGGEYKVVVRVWDSVARESTPGDPVYTDASRDFTFELDNTVDPVSSFTVTASDGAPVNTSGWTRATAPDSYTMLRGLTLDSMVAIAANLQAADLLVSGTTYEYVDLTASPRTQYFYSVVAVVGGVSSDDNPTDTVTAEPEGVWLSTLDGEHTLCIDGTIDVRWEPSEQVAVHRPLEADNPVLITQGGNLRQGSIAGSITPRHPDSQAAAVAEWDYLTAQEQRGETLILTLADTSIRVFIYQTLRENADEEFADVPVSFRFCELT